MEKRFNVLNLIDVELGLMGDQHLPRQTIQQLAGIVTNIDFLPVNLFVLFEQC